MTSPSRLPKDLGNIAGSSAFGFGVGDKAFLASEGAGRVSKYFRSIEFGTEGFEGRVLFGAWGLGPRGGFPTGGLTGFGEGSGQQFFPYRKTTAFHRLRGYAKKGEEGRSSLKGVVGHEIEGKEAYRYAAEAFNPAERERDAIAQAFEHAGFRQGQGRGPKKNLAQASKARNAQFLKKNLRGGFLTGFATSTSSTNLLNLEKQLRQELIRANRLLAEALAGEVAQIYQEELLRPDASSGLLEHVTLDARNRFPV